MIRPATHLAIDTLALHGFDPRDRGALVAAIARELSQRLGGDDAGTLRGAAAFGAARDGRAALSAAVERALASGGWR